MSGSRRDRGQAAVVVVMVATVLFVAVTLGASMIGGRLLDRTRAQTAADAAALAAFDGGRDAVDDLARRHGATVVEFVAGPGAHRVTVVVRVGESTATAVAVNEP